MIKILLILFVIDTVINYFVGNYIKNDFRNTFKHILTNTPASIIFTITRLLQIVLLIWIVIKLILMI